MAARLLDCIRHLTAFLEILHSVRDDGQVSYFSPGRKQRTIQVNISGTVESVPQFTTARGKAVIVLLSSPIRSPSVPAPIPSDSFHRFDWKILNFKPYRFGSIFSFSTTFAYLTVFLYSVFFSGKEDLIRWKLFAQCKASSSYFFSAGIIFQNADEMASLGTEALKKAVNGVTERVSSTSLDLSRDISESYFDEEITDENDFTQEPLSDLSTYPSAHNLCPLSRAPRPGRLKVKYGLQVRRLNCNLELSATFFITQPTISSIHVRAPVRWCYTKSPNDGNCQKRWFVECSWMCEPSPVWTITVTTQLASDSHEDVLRVRHARSCLTNSWRTPTNVCVGGYYTVTLFIINALPNSSQSLGIFKSQLTT